MDSPQMPGKKFRPMGVKKRYSLGALMAMGITLVYWLQGFAVVCPHMPEGFPRDLCVAATSSGRALPAPMDSPDGGT